MPRPVSTLVLGILNLVFGAMGLLGIAMTMAMVFIPQPKSPSPNPNPFMGLIQENEGYALFMKISVPLGLVASVVLILAGVGLLRLRSWGRHLSIGYAIYAIIAAIVGAAANCYFLMPLVQKALRMPGGPEQMGLIGGVIGGMVGGCVGVLYPAILLFFMFRPNVVAAMQPPCCAEIVAN